LFFKNVRKMKKKVFYIIFNRCLSTKNPVVSNPWSSSSSIWSSVNITSFTVKGRSDRGGDSSAFWSRDWIGPGTGGETDKTDPKTTAKVALNYRVKLNFYNLEWWPFSTICAVKNATKKYIKKRLGGSRWLIWIQFIVNLRAKICSKILLISAT